MQSAFDRGQQLRLGQVGRIDTQPGRDDAQQVVGGDCGRHDRDDVQSGGIEQAGQMPHQRRLARADIAGHDDEPLALRDAIAQIGHRLAMRRRLIPEAGVRGELEGASGQPEMVFVHPVRPLEGIARGDQRLRGPSGVQIARVERINARTGRGGDPAEAVPIAGSAAIGPDAGRLCNARFVIIDEQVAVDGRDRRQLAVEEQLAIGALILDPVQRHAGHVVAVEQLAVRIADAAAIGGATARDRQHRIDAARAIAGGLDRLEHVVQAAARRRAAGRKDAAVELLRERIARGDEAGRELL
ncbi:hypothetical protein WR25_25551 [Diploscapter pachys]|uniref:Uncharacterized protein n=1 Tax=Diploscapter pachys TaxID=2018661 RepID=A0A2A2K2P4_9BILA|nr:hypothetical protein WR25_25551 [Diploscapter pachys]